MHIAELDLLQNYHLYQFGPSVIIKNQNVTFFLLLGTATAFSFLVLVLLNLCYYFEFLSNLLLQSDPY